MKQRELFTPTAAGEIENAGTITGACVHRSLTAAPIRLRVRSNSPGMSWNANTITRAELAAILVALRECRAEADEIIATDSKCSMDKLAMQLSDPTSTANDPHRPMLKAIVQLLLDRARNAQVTRLMKAISHIGIDGNEQADMLANEAAECVAKSKQRRLVSWIGMYHKSIVRTLITSFGLNRRLGQNKMGKQACKTSGTWMML